MKRHLKDMYSVDSDQLPNKKDFKEITRRVEFRQRMRLKEIDSFKKSPSGIQMKAEDYNLYKEIIREMENSYTTNYTTGYRL